jgi:hypothetical protein
VPEDQAGVDLTMTKAAQAALDPVFEETWLMDLVVLGKGKEFFRMSAFALRAFQLGRAFGRSEALRSSE